MEPDEPDEPTAEAVEPAPEAPKPPPRRGRYAGVSGDRNPIHMSPLGGKAFGFPSSIAHGAWTAAAILRVLEGHIPDAVVYHVRFGRPVVLPAKIGLFVTRTDESTEIVARDLKKGFPHVTATVTPL